MRGRKVLFGSALAAVTLAGSLFASAPASADKATGGTCPSSFTLATDKQVAKLLNTNSLADVQAIDKNANGFVCYNAQGQGNGAGYNVIDDKV
jgi:hypothetical protein